MSESLSYRTAGVDTEAGDRAVELMKAAVGRTHTAGVVGGQGGFAGMVDVSDLRDYRRPLLATSTDGVGTKIALAQALDIHDTIGQDLVAMVVDDVVVVGATPLLMTDYIACGRVEPQRIADIVRGVAQACEQVGVPLLGGETAEHPGVMAPDDYDIAGAATGVVEADAVLGAHHVRAGDVLVALPASGLHSNGYSLVRKVLEVSGAGLGEHVAEFGRTVGEELLEPTRLYTRACLDLIAALGGTTGAATADVPPVGGVHALSHVTGAGLAANVARVLPAGLAAVIDRGSWVVPPVFEWVGRSGNVAWDDLEVTLNLGVGMVAIVAADAVDAALTAAAAADLPAWVLGEVHDVATAVAQAPAARVTTGAKGVTGGQVRMIGSYRTA
ncbi:phosphoribosylformylglycinamidine cyclo-ligase [Buchananella hordeovulneris]|uniref:Phosphoribosylformylglycinamidine cyclo-ligase n=1 Tax=Buchananella hordeovulneris TaxID=52770 RepID=A0A1Q5PY90_9ACTO|nr:phosphoribosylformylglycinamidine cyclo-ligase [Buchananella hordeovulneris]OKL52578.1 phosphoribosylformylglycinamidine cyclo-ligase [Buchananella hordeovulneris]